VDAVVTEVGDETPGYAGYAVRFDHVERLSLVVDPVF
jgi:hypothetical protein